MQKHGNLAIFVPHKGCPHQCSFCNQRAISGHSQMPTPNEVATLCKEAIEQKSDRTFELAFFGGSFTAIHRDKMVMLLQSVQPFIKNGIDGIRISTRPDAIDQDVLDILKAYGVTAIELGAQSMVDEVLIKNRRGHTPQHVRDAAKLILQNGFSLGLQMMIGLYGEKAGDEIFTAKEIIKLAPHTVRIYPTLVVKETPLADLLLSNEYTPLSLEEGVKRTAGVMELFEQSNIRIIRVGLHPSLELEQGLIAGPYHQAFRELCQSQIMLNRIMPQLAKCEKGEITILVNPSDISKMVGQKKANLKALCQLGFIAKVVASKEVEPLFPQLCTGNLFSNEVIK